MACCCQSGKSQKSAASCLGRCDLPKHKCLDRSVKTPKKGPVPSHMGWHYTAKGAPDHQLRCGWRPGHIFCPVLKRIERHRCMKVDCGACSSLCSSFPCTSKPCCAMPPKCATVFPGAPSSCKSPQACGQPLIRIVRHAGQYRIETKPSDISNAPSGPYPLKYVLNTEDDAGNDGKAKYSVEAKFNDYHFDYTASQGSFILDFAPPQPGCLRPCNRALPCPTCLSEGKCPMPPPKCP